MEHQEVLDLLPAYVDRELGTSDALGIERHLAECTNCQLEYVEQTKVSSLLRKDAAHFTASAALVQRIKHALPVTVPKPAVGKEWRLNFLNVGAAMAVVFMAIGSAHMYLTIPTAEERLAEEVISSHVRSLQANHLSDIASSDQHTVKPWFNGKLNYAPPVIDLALRNFPLMGGRLDYLEGHPVAALVYRHKQHPINLYAWPVNSGDMTVHLQSRQGYNLVHWAAKGMTYWAVSDLAPSELATFVEIIQAQRN